MRNKKRSCIISNGRRFKGTPASSCTCLWIRLKIRLRRIHVFITVNKCSCSAAATAQRVHSDIHRRISLLTSSSRAKSYLTLIGAGWGFNVPPRQRTQSHGNHVPGGPGVAKERSPRGCCPLHPCPGGSQRGGGRGRGPAVRRWANTPPNNSSPNTPYNNESIINDSYRIP